MCHSCKEKEGSLQRDSVSIRFAPRIVCKPFLTAL